MKRFYKVIFREWSELDNCFLIVRSVYENKEDALALFEAIEISANVPNVQVWEQLCKNDGCVQAQRRIASKNFNC